ncbi:MAG: hypothetical protein AABX32_00720 [Nanoarchaeota archaeon]
MNKSVKYAGIAALAMSLTAPLNSFAAGTSKDSFRLHQINTIREYLSHAGPPCRYPEGEISHTGYSLMLPINDSEGGITIEMLSGNVKGHKILVIKCVEPSTYCGIKDGVKLYPQPIMSDGTTERDLDGIIDGARDGEEWINTGKKSLRGKIQELYDNILSRVYAQIIKDRLSKANP